MIRKYRRYSAKNRKFILLYVSKSSTIKHRLISNCEIGSIREESQTETKKKDFKIFIFFILACRLFSHTKS